ncbi:twin-arginine translocation signal domain-containing protein [Halostella sp. JP-L12]|uniref:twin-arginine translocation signal domain-containing protein n=1 Tax=Halostella TaxID=1843185 RepID=UPI000EF82BB8|nr:MULTISPECIES: twin-arginine translocation signal domain-containing protein [Halostella]NHN46285.1 twin-arginine translocation signal domain-containing protein [Halostella sp. JP-L12]
MTDDSLLERIADDETRRSFIKKSAVTTAGTGLALSGTASAQDDDAGSGGLDDDWKALIQASNFHPEGKFAIVSGVVSWTPNYGDIQDSFFSDYNTRMIRWQNTGEVVPLWAAEEANLGSFDGDRGFVSDAHDDQDQPQLFQMNKEWTPFGDNPELVTVKVSPVNEDDEDSLLDVDEWFVDGDDES